MKNILLLFSLTILITGCKAQQYETIYKASCNESPEVPFAKLNKDSTCNGQPLVLAIASSTNAELQASLSDDSSELEILLSEFPAMLNLREPKTLRTPLMVSLTSHNYAAAEVLAGHEYTLDKIDSSGTDVLLYLITAPESVTKNIHTAPGIIRDLLAAEKKLGSSNALTSSIQAKNYAFAWRIITLLKGEVDFSKISAGPLPQGFFFAVELEKNPKLLDGFAQQLLKTYSGEIRDNDSTRTVQNYSMLHFAAAHNMSTVFNYLLAHGAIVDSVSSDGSPLALALKANWSSQIEYNSRIEIIESLLKQPRAVRVPDALAASLKAEVASWAKRLIDSGATLSTYNDVLFYKSHELVVDQSTGKYSDDDSGNTGPMQASYLTLTGGHDISNWQTTFGGMRELPSFDDHPNGIEQTLIDFFLFAIPPSKYSDFPKGFQSVIEIASQFGDMDKSDALGMLPIHYWLASPWRASLINDPKEPARLRQVLKATKGWSAFTVNRDSILSLAVMTGNLSLVKEIIKTVPTMRNSINLPNLLGKSPIQIAKDHQFRSIYAFLNSF